MFETITETFLPSEKELLKGLGLDKEGRVQKVVDETFIHYMRLKMPKQEGIMMQNTRNRAGGLVTVEVPYAHYQNEGILYVMDNGKGAYYSDTYGFWSKPHAKKHPSGRELNYHGGPDRGAHFVERTLNENFDDILRAAQKELEK